MGVEVDLVIHEVEEEGLAEVVAVEMISLEMLMTVRIKVTTGTVQEVDVEASAVVMALGIHQTTIIKIETFPEAVVAAEVAVVVQNTPQSLDLITRVNIVKVTQIEAHEVSITECLAMTVGIDMTKKISMARPCRTEEVDEVGGHQGPSRQMKMMHTETFHRSAVFAEETEMIRIITVVPVMRRVSIRIRMFVCRMRTTMVELMEQGILERDLNLVEVM